MSHNKKIIIFLLALYRIKTPIFLTVVLIFLLGLLHYQNQIYNQGEVFAAQIESRFIPTPTISEPTPAVTPTPTLTPTPTKTINTPVNHTQTNSIQVPILMYHYIGNNPNPADHARDILSVTPDKFEAQMKYLSDNGFQTITFDTLYPSLTQNQPLPPKPIILTFDDAYVDFYFNAYPILLKYNLLSTVFVPTNLVGKPAYMNWDQITQLNSTGRVNFLAHSQNHSYLTTLSDNDLTKELTISKKQLEDKLGKPINFMAYPYGAVNNRVIEVTKKVGYLGAAGTWISKFHSQSTLYDMPRLRITGNMDLETYKKLI